MHERLRIHHGVGSRVLFDSDNEDTSFTYKRLTEGWIFRVLTDNTPAIDEILRLKDEINVFIFKEQDGAAFEKVWFYTGDGRVAYNETEKCLTIEATGHISYHPDDFQ